MAIQIFLISVDADKGSEQMAVRKDDSQRNLAFLLEKVEGCAVSNEIVIKFDYIIRKVKGFAVAEDNRTFDVKKIELAA